MHTYVCQQCGHKATRNIQLQWHEYSISNDEDFQLVDDGEVVENIFLCDECDN